jgi:hypothetical protein
LDLVISVVRVLNFGEPKKISRCKEQAEAIGCAFSADHAVNPLRELLLLENSFY